MYYQQEWEKPTYRTRVFKPMQVTCRNKDYLFNGLAKYDMEILQVWGFFLSWNRSITKSKLLCLTKNLITLKKSWCGKEAVFFMLSDEIVASSFSILVTENSRFVIFFQVPMNKDSLKLQSYVSGNPTMSEKNMIRWTKFFRVHVIYLLLQCIGLQEMFLHDCDHTFFYFGKKVNVIPKMIRKVYRQILIKTICLS